MDRRIVRGMENGVDGMTKLREKRTYTDGSIIVRGKAFRKGGR
jgi:hypothetical protein